MALDFDDLRFAEPIDKLDSGIEKTNEVVFRPADP